MPHHYPITVPIDIGSERGTTCHVSTTTVSFRAASAYTAGSIIDFIVHLDDRQSEFRMDCRGRVMRCEPDGAGWVTNATIDTIRIGETVIGKKL